jgi:hypothetical protein
MKLQFVRPVRSAMVVALACAGVLLLATPAQAAKKKASTTTTEAHDYNERLVNEFTPWVGGREATEALVTRLRNGRPANSTDADVPTAATAPLSYGETRYALKLAQGRLAQEGVTQPNTDHLHAALYGGTLDLPAGTKVLAGVLPQHARGVSWGSLAQDVGMTVEDLIPPASVRAKNTQRSAPAKAKKAGKKTANKTSTKATTARKTGKSTAQHSKSAAKKPTRKP